MAGKHLYASVTSRDRDRPLRISPLLIFTLSILVLCFIFFVFFSSSSSSSFPSIKSSLSFPNPNPNPNFEYSFVASLENFLTKISSHPPKDDDTVTTFNEHILTNLDDSIWATENDRIYHHPLYPAAASMPLRVYVYQMPSKFTYDLLWLFRNTFKDTSNLTSNGSPVHRLIEQHSIDYWLWADLIAPQSQRLLQNVIRVYKQDEADFFYIPFFTTISFFLLEKQHCKALYRVKC